MKILYCQLQCRSDSFGSDLTNVLALERANKFFDAVMFVVPSWQEKPDATNNSIVRMALYLCKNYYGLKVIWGRNLWVAWPTNNIYMPHAESHNLPEYYVAAIKNVQQEAKYIGAEGTYLDCEPYGMSEQKETLKKATTHTEVEIAISDAINVVGLVDYVSPTSSSNSERYVWYMGNLGDIRLDLKPYYVNTSTGKVVHNPPGDFIYTMGGWGSFVTNPSRNINPKAKTLTVEEAKAIDLKVVRLTYPDCWHHWVYIPYKEFADVVRRF